MPLPLRRRIPWPVMLVLLLIMLREWNIRRHEADLGNWPRADRQPVAT